MRKCAVCGTENEDNAVFCELCGNRFAIENEEVLDNPIVIDDDNLESDDANSAISGKTQSDYFVQEAGNADAQANSGDTSDYYPEVIYSDSQQNGASKHRRHSNSSSLILFLFAIGSLIAIAVILATSSKKGVDQESILKNSIEILADDFTVMVGQTVELEIRSSVPELNANYNDCIDTYWNSDKASEDNYYLEVMGMEEGTCYLTVHGDGNNDKDLYDTVVIRVVSSDKDTTTDQVGESIDSPTAARILNVPEIEDIVCNANGVFVGETQTISEEAIVSFAGSLDFDGASNIYSYTAPRDGRYGFEILNINASDSVHLVIYSSTSDVLLDNWSGTGYVNMKANETYEIQVRQDRGYPEYTLNLYVQKPTVELSNTTTVYDQVSFKDQKNIYSFTAPVTGRYHFELTDYNSGTGFRMLMWDKYENNIMDSWSESATVNLDAGETYEFQIRQDEKIGSYVLNIGFQKESVDLTNVTVLYDSIEYTDQKNVYTFTAHVAGRYHFELSEYKNGVSFRMMMWDKYENNIMDSWTESATVDLEAGETYEFQIRQDEGFYSYKLNIGLQKETVDITGYDIITDSVAFEDQKNVYLFTPSTAGTYTFSLGDFDASCSVRLLVWDNYENNIMDTYNEGGTINLESGITYEIQIRQDESFGSYKLYVKQG